MQETGLEAEGSPGKCSPVKLFCFLTSRVTAMREFSLAPLCSLTSQESSVLKNKFWKSTQRNLSSSKNIVLNVANPADVETLNSLIMSKVQSLKSLPNVYIKQSTS